MYSDDAVLKLYTEFRKDPANVRLNDNFFCITNGIAVPRLKELLKENPKVIHEIESREVSDDELSTLMGLLTRLCYHKAFINSVPVKSLEGLVNAIIGLMKQRQLETGRPTEIIKFEEDAEKKTPEELHSYIMGMLRKPMRN